MKNIKLVLEDGTELAGKSFGAFTSSAGEVVFNTAMTGYPESLTDPSYRGQILVLTFPLVGNYGVPSQEKHQHELEKFLESEQVHIAGLVIANYAENHNHWNADQSLSEWLATENIPGICDIDTRALTQKLRENGAMKGKIITERDIDFIDIEAKNLVDEVSVKEPVVYGNGKKKIVLVDCGVKNNIIRCFLKRDVTLTRVPWDYDFSNLDYDGLFISNGPGDPKKCEKTIQNLKKALQEEKPIFGICLGNQLLGLASGADTYKLKYGHRSHNQPAINIQTQKCYITSQNHGYALDDNTLSADWEPFFRNLNDGTNEGIKHKTKPFFSVQFHPEANGGPVDTEYLFDEFLANVK